MGLLNSHLDEVLQKLLKILQKVKDPLTDDWDPVEVGLLISSLEYDDLDTAAYLKMFDDMARPLSELKPADINLHDKVKKINTFFSDQLDFKGDKTNYYNIKNSFLSDLLVRRKGIPVTLSLVYMGLCRVAGLRSVGINFPGHFLVEVIPTKKQLQKSSEELSLEEAGDWTERCFVDCYDGAKIVSTKDCEKRLNEWTRGMIPFGPDVLKLSHPVDILSRMLRNLKAILVEKEDLTRLYWVLTAIIELCPQDSLDAYRERGMLMGRIGRYKAAAKDLQTYLDRSQDRVRAGHVVQMLQIFESRSDVMN